MTRVGLLPENAFGELLASLENEIRGFKNKQKHSGESGLVGYFVQTPDTWDDTDSLNTGSPSVGQGADFEIIFTSSGKQPFPIEQIYLDIFFGGTAPGNRPTRATNGQYQWTDGTNSVVVVGYPPEFDKAYSDNETQYKWTFGLIIFGNITWYFKVYVAGSSDGSIVVNRTF